MLCVTFSSVVCCKVLELNWAWAWLMLSPSPATQSCCASQNRSSTVHRPLRISCLCNCEMKQMSTRRQELRQLAPGSSGLCQRAPEQSLKQTSVINEHLHEMRRAFCDCKGQQSSTHPRHLPAHVLSQSIPLQVLKETACKQVYTSSAVSWRHDT